MRHDKILKILLGVGPALMLGGCDAVLLNPSGDVALQQRNLIYMATGLMLIVILPVIVATILFAWRYRAANRKARYDADWDHSTRLELVIWSVPLLIIIALGSITWVSTHLLDPYRPLSRISADKPLAAHVEPLTVEVVALDWKWLFIYPEYGFATVNELAAPVDRPIRFKITASSVMNSFFIPALDRPDLRHAGHADHAARGDQRDPANTRACPRTTAAPAFPACISVSTAWTRPDSTPGWRRTAQPAASWTAPGIWTWNGPARMIRCAAGRPSTPTCTV